MEKSQSPYEVIQIDENSWRIEENGVRSFLFAGKDKALLVDSGFGTGNIKDAVDSLTTLPVMLINTHADRDHIGCNNQFEKIFMHPAEFDRYNQNLQSQGGSMDFGTNAIWEHDIIDIGGRSFEVILIPGHTPGSIALLDSENRILISGDSVQAGMVYMFGPGRNINAYIHSMKKLSDINIRGRFDTVYPSHGPFPVNADIMDALISGADDVRGGKISGTKPPYETQSPALLYDLGAVRFLYK